MEKYLINVSKIFDTGEIRNIETIIKLDSFILRASNIESKKLEVKLRIEPTKVQGFRAVLIAGEVKGVLIMSCHRCMEIFEHPLDLEIEQLYSSENDLVEESKTIENNEIDIIPVIKEALTLNLPIKLLCTLDCKGLCSGCGRNLNKEPCLCEDKPIDIRWQKLGEYFKKEKDS